MTDDLFARADSLHAAGRFKRAYAIFLSLAEAGDGGAMARLGLMLEYGEGTPRDLDAAIAWTKKGAALGDIAAILNLGVHYRGLGETLKAKACFEKALKRGDDEAALELAKMYLISEHETQRVTSYLRHVLAADNVTPNGRAEAKALLKRLKRRRAAAS